MTKEERLILVAQLCETASLLILLGALLWNFRHKELKNARVVIAPCRL